MDELSDGSFSAVFEVSYMNTKEDIEDEIFNLQIDIFIWFADLAPYFTDASSFNDVAEEDLPYFRNIARLLSAFILFVIITA